MIATKKWLKAFRKIRHGLKVKGWGYMDNGYSLDNWRYGRKLCPRCPCGAEMYVTMHQTYTIIQFDKPQLLTTKYDSKVLCPTCGRRASATEEAHLTPYDAQLCVLNIEWVKEPLINVETEKVTRK